MNSRQLSDLIEDAKEPNETGGWWSGRCPAHDDETASLSWKDGDNKIVFKCFAGCERREILSTLDLSEAVVRIDAAPKPKAAQTPLTMADLAEAKGLSVEVLGQWAAQEGGRIRIPYKMMDGAAAPRYQIRQTGTPKFVWSAGKAAIVPYGLDRLAALRERPEAQRYLFLVEGASDCWSAWSVDEPCLGLPGADTAKLLKVEYLDGVNAVFVVREPDSGGDVFLRKVSMRLQDIGFTGLAYEVRMPDDLKDVNDLLRRNPAAFRDELRRAREIAVPIERDRIALVATPVEGKRYLRRPGGNRDRLVDSFGQDIAYATGLGWMDWQGTHWRRDVEELLLRRRGEAVVRQLKDEADELQRQADAEQDPKAKAAANVIAARARMWHAQCYARAPMDEMVELAKHVPPIYRSAEEFDARRTLFCAKNGTVDLATGEFREHRREDLITYISPVAYDPQAQCPRWEQFIREVMVGDRDMIAYVQRLVGYCLTGEVSEDAFFIFYGLGSNGKTTFLEVLRRVLGYDYAKATPAATFLKKSESSSGASPEIARLRGTRLVTAVEVERAQRLATGMVKAAAGGDRQVARFLYQDLMEFDGQYKVILAVNNRPEIHDQSKGMWRRVHLVPWLATFDETTPGFDRRLDEILLRELPGILRWCVAGAVQWSSFGLKPPEKVLAATREYREEQDNFGDFLRRYTFDRRLWTEVDAVHREFTTWAVMSSEKSRSKMELTQLLAERGFPVKVQRVPDPVTGKTKPARCYIGLAVTPVTPVTPDRNFDFRSSGAVRPATAMNPPEKNLSGAVTPVTGVTGPAEFRWNAYTPPRVVDLLAAGKTDDPQALVDHIDMYGDETCPDPACPVHAAWTPIPETPELERRRLSLMED